VTITYDLATDACPTFQPDVMARKANVATFTDVDAYTVATTAATTVTKLHSVTFVVRLFNDGNTAQTINLTGTLAGNPKLTYTFKDGVTVVPTLTTTGVSYALPPGGLKQLTVTVKATAGTRRLTQRTA